MNSDAALDVMDRLIFRLEDPEDGARLAMARVDLAELLAAAEALEHGVSAEKLVRLAEAIRAVRGAA